MRSVTDSAWPDRYLVRRTGFEIETHAPTRRTTFGKQGENSMRLVQSSSILLLSSALALTACGGSSGGDDDGGTVDPAGTAHTYVVSRIRLPVAAGEGNKYGIDLDGDGNIDNALGNILSALSGAASGSLELQGPLDSSVLQGKIV